MLLIVGLGNPGREYARSRHNVGFMCVDFMARRWGIRLSQRRHLVVLGLGEVEGQEVVLAKPRTYVNRSGDAVRYLFSRFSADNDNLLVIYDDMDLPPGRIRIRPQGGAAGHNGVKSIIAELGSQQFARVRVGIGRPANPQNDVSYVLGHFSKEQREVLKVALDRVADALVILLTEGMDQAMNRFNQEAVP